MELWQRNYIKENLFNLVTDTNCNAQFISALSPLLSESDKSELKAKQKSEGNVEQAMRLFEISLTKTGMYEQLTKASFLTAQLGTFQILLNGFLQQGVSGVLKTCGINEHDENLYMALKGFENRASQSLISFQGQIVQLHELTTAFKETLTLENCLEGKLFMQLINRNPINIFKENIPKLLEYYIARRLTSRHHLNPRIFDKHCEDIYVFRHIQLNELCALAKNQGIDVSSNQAQHLSVRFILLEYEEDYHRLCKLSAVPVHLIDHIDEQFYWVNSCGSISTIQESVHDLQVELKEVDCVNSCMKTKNPVCISDTPGMGKTVLLASLAHQVIKNHPKHLVQFIVLREFVQDVQNKKAGKIDDKFLMELIAEQASEYECGRNIVMHWIQSDNQSVELMFDGFDEVLVDQIEDCIQILKLIKSWKSTRLYVTTRPHMRGELEEILGTLSYNIKAFGGDEQIEFLTTYWTQSSGANNNSRLNEFARKCLHTLKENMNDFERDIAGIPLQCKLLAEVYEHQAVTYSKPETRLARFDLGIEINIRSIFEMYKKLMELRFSRFKSKPEKESWWAKVSTLFTKEKQRKLSHAHIFAAIELIFPDKALMFKDTVGDTNQIESRELYNLGILEKRGNDNTPRFVHRTFAEYFLGQFVAQMLTYQTEFGWQVSIRKKFLDYFYNTVLFTNKLNEYLLNSSNVSSVSEPMQSASFQYPVICYFINGHLKQMEIPIPKRLAVMSIWEAEFDAEKLFDVVAASIHHDYLALYSQINDPEIHKHLLGTVSVKLGHLLLHAAKYSSWDLFTETRKQLMKSLTEDSFVSSKDPEFVITPLHVAAERGSFQIVTYLLNNITDSIELRGIKYLMHCCVAGSIRNCKYTIQQKLQMITLLCSKNFIWINEPLPDGTTPLLQYSVHAKLMQRLVECGAVMSATNQEGCVLHKLVQNEMSPQDYHDLLTSLESRGFNQLSTPDQQLCCPLHVSVQKIELLPETIQIFHSNHVDFNATDKNGDSVLFYAIRGGRSMSLILMLVSLGSNLTHKNLNNEGVFHISSKYGNLEVLESLLMRSHINVSEVCTPNKSGHTPFYQGLAVGKGLNIRVIKLMMEHGLKVTKDVASQALKAFICNSNIMASELNTEFVKVADFLLKRGGVLTCRNKMSPWKLETTQKNIQAIKKATHCRMELLKELAKRGISADILETTENPTEVLFETLLSSTCNSFERLCISLISCGQLKPFLLLKQCLQSDIQESLMFVTPPNGLVDFIHSKYDQVIVLISLKKSLTLTRIKDTINPDPLVINDDDLATLGFPPKSRLIVYRCDTVTKEVIQDLQAMESKTVCLCAKVSGGLVNIQILEEKVLWDDLSTDFQNDLVSFTRTEAKEDQGFTTSYKELENKALVDFIMLNVPQVIEPYTADKNCFISNTIFHYFLSDKLVFKRIRRQQVSVFAKYGQKIGGPRNELSTLDYVIVQSDEQFNEVASKNPDNITHLIEHQNGQFKLLKSSGSTKNIMRFIEKNHAQKCEDFPVCLCGRHPWGSGNLIWNLFQMPSKNHTYWVNILDVISNLHQVTEKNESLRIQKLKNLFKSACLGHNNLECWRNIKKALPSIEFKTDKIHSSEFNTLLRCIGNDRTNLEFVAIKTTFPFMEITSKIGGLEKYVDVGLLKHNENGNLVFVHHNLSFYLIADFISREGSQQYVNVSELRKKVFSNCTQPHDFKLSFEWVPCQIFSRKFKSYCFKPTKAKFFKYLESIVSVNHNDLAIHLWQAINWIHACINADHFYLLQLLLSRGVHGSLFHSEELVVLAVMHADVPLINLVIEQFVQQTKRNVCGIKIEVMNRSSLTYKFSHYTISLLHVAALRGDYEVMQYLLSKQGFKETISKPPMRDLLHHCVNKLQETQTLQRVEQRLQIIKLLTDLDSTLIAERDGVLRSPLLVPNIPLQIIEYYICTCFQDVDITDLHLNNILHLCPRHLTPECYEKLVKEVLNSGNIQVNSKIFHAKNVDECTPLHKLVETMEPLNSTIEFLSKTIKVDMNAVSKQNKTVLIQAVEHFRSARVLDALISFGADINKRCQDKKTVLHVAAEKGNLTAVKHFLSRGFNANYTDEHNNNALHQALKMSLRDTVGIVQALVQGGANVNAVDQHKKSPLAIASERKYNPQTKDRIVKILSKAGAK